MQILLIASISSSVYKVPFSANCVIETPDIKELDLRLKFISLINEEMLLLKISWLK